MTTLTIRITILTMDRMTVVLKRTTTALMDMDLTDHQSMAATDTIPIGTMAAQAKNGPVTEAAMARICLTTKL